MTNVPSDCPFGLPYAIILYVIEIAVKNNFQRGTVEIV